MHCGGALKQINYSSNWTEIRPDGARAWEDILALQPLARLLGHHPVGRAGLGSLAANCDRARTGMKGFIFASSMVRRW